MEHRLDQHLDQLDREYEEQDPYLEYLSQQYRVYDGGKAGVAVQRNGKPVLYIADVGSHHAQLTLAQWLVDRMNGK